MNTRIVNLNGMNNNLINKRQEKKTYFNKFVVENKKEDKINNF